MSEWRARQTVEKHKNATPSRREAKHRFRMELAMVVATSLAAVAAIFSSFVAVRQLDAMESALVSQDRNTAFMRVYNTVKSVCDFRRPVQSRLNGKEAPLFEQDTETAQKILWEDVDRVRSEMSVLRIWLPPDAQQTSLNLEANYLKAMLAYGKDIEGDEVDILKRNDAALVAADACFSFQTDLVNWYSGRQGHPRLKASFID